jgi:hypothetical protein
MTAFGLDKLSSILATTSMPILGSTQTPIQWELGGISSGVKRPERDASHSKYSAKINPLKPSCNYMYHLL